VNFTREPIIETIITPKEGYKLSVRSSKSEPGEEYLVDALEVVSFGQSLFFRSLEKPKSFLVPVSDYEVVEVKETRAVLKNAQFGTVKIGGGREATLRRESDEEEAAVPDEVQEENTEQPQEAGGRFGGRKRDRRRHGGRRRPEDRPQLEMPPRQEPVEGAALEQPSTPPPMPTLIPPPSTLISDTIGRYKEQQAAEKPPQTPGEETTLNRVALETKTILSPPMTDWTRFLS
jgi:hypothetical protein